MQVVRGFTDRDAVHVDGEVELASDMETINTELILADPQTLEKALSLSEQGVKGKRLDGSVLEAAQEAKGAFGEVKLLSQTTADLDPIRELGLFTSNPVLFRVQRGRGRAKQPGQTR